MLLFSFPLQFITDMPREESLLFFMFHFTVRNAVSRFVVRLQFSSQLYFFKLNTAVTYLNKAVIPQRMDFPVKTETKQRSKKATEKHPRGQVVSEGQALSKNATVRTIQNQIVIMYLKYMQNILHLIYPVFNIDIIPEEHADRVCHKEAVVQHSKQILIIFLV